MKEFDEETLSRYADKLLSAMKREALMNKEVAAIFDATSADMSNMKRQDTYHKISTRLWGDVRLWYYSEMPLRQFKLDEWKEKAAKMAPIDIATTLTDAPQINTEDIHRLKRESREAAGKLRDEYEKRAIEAGVEAIKKDQQDYDNFRSYMREEFEHTHSITRKPEEIRLKDGRVIATIDILEGGGLIVRIP